MRWLLFLALAGCSTFQEWQATSADRETLPLLLKALRGAKGDANLIAVDRYYQIRGEAMQPELLAMTCALADAVEAQWTDPPAVLWDHEFERMGRRPRPRPAVESFTYADRALSISRGEVSVKAIRTDQGVYWLARARQRPDLYIQAEVRTTSAIDVAWQRLVRNARSRAGTPWTDFLLWPEIDDVGIDIMVYPAPPDGAGQP